MNAPPTGTDPLPGSAAWAENGRKTLALMMVDLVESVRLYEIDPDSTARRWRRFVHEVQTGILPAHAGSRMVRHTGDGLLLTFPDALAAVRCAFVLHEALGGYNAGRLPTESLLLRIGVHVDTVFVDELDAFGYGVNLVARLMALAGPAEAVTSTEVRDGVVPGVDAEFDDLGLCYLKHISKPVRAYRLARAGEAAPGVVAGTVRALPHARPARAAPDRGRVALRGTCRRSRGTRSSRPGRGQAHCRAVARRGCA
ncbi:MAG: adenylate/guanylate cyclase domain-containing protein [Rubrivivax sp.]